jgi:hypothetical protein
MVKPRAVFRPPGSFERQEEVLRRQLTDVDPRVCPKCPEYLPEKREYDQRLNQLTPAIGDLLRHALLESYGMGDLYFEPQQPEGDTSNDWLYS